MTVTTEITTGAHPLVRSKMVIIVMEAPVFALLLDLIVETEVSMFPENSVMMETMLMEMDVLPVEPSQAINALTMFVPNSLKTPVCPSMETPSPTITMSSSLSKLPSSTTLPTRKK